MLTFEEIEDCFPDGAHAAIDDDGNETGFTFVSAQWLHDFAHAVATREREACAKGCDEIALRHQQTEGTYAAGKKAGAFECAETLRSNAG